ncbi:MAG: branched-chain amino acid ABC transporter permease [Anaerocolumna sp.]
MMNKTNTKTILYYLIILAVLGLAVFVSFNKYYVIVATNAVINAMAVLGIIVISGYAKQLHLGQSAFIGIGAYTTGVLMVKCGVPFFATIPAAVILSGFFGWILSIPTLKLKGGSYLALVTQIFGEIIYVLLLNLESITNGAFGLSKINAPNIGFLKLGQRQPFFFFTLICFIIIFIGLKRVLSSKYGRFFISIRESEDAAESLGISTRKYKMIAFIIATSIAGFSGSLYATNLRYLSPEQFRWSPSLTLVSMAIVGGLYSLKGGILGSVILTLLPEVLRFTDEFRMIIYGIIVILVLAFLPNGLISLFGKSRKELKEMFTSQWDILSDKTLRMKKKKLKTVKMEKNLGTVAK